MTSRPFFGYIVQKT